MSKRDRDEIELERWSWYELWKQSISFLGVYILGIASFDSEEIHIFSSRCVCRFMVYGLSVFGIHTEERVFVFVS